MSNLLNTLKELVTNQLVSSIAKHIDSNEGGVSTALNLSLPVLLQCILTSPFTKHEIVGDVIQKAATHENYLAHLLAGLENKESSVPAQIGSGLVDLLLGNQSRSIANLISHQSRLQPDNCLLINQLGASVIAYFLGKKMQKEEISIHGILASLHHHRNEFQELIPQHILDRLQPTDSVNYDQSNSQPTKTKFVRKPFNDKNGNRWLLPIILFCLLGIGIWYWIKGYYHESEMTINITNPVYDTAENSVQNEVSGKADTPMIENKATTGSLGNIDEAGNWIATKGEPIKIKLANGTELDATKNSLEDKLYNFIVDPSATSSNLTWFSFDDLRFESGKSTLKNTELRQLKNVCEILKAYPKVKIKLGGYTDDTGDSVKNTSLSLSRARTVYNLMQKEGASKLSFTDQTPYEGYGPQFPIGDNTTDEGRAQNRRIALSVRAK